MPSPPIRGINDCSVAEGTIACQPTSHTLAEEAGPGGRVWCHMVPPAVAPAEWVNRNKKINNLWPLDWPEESVAGSEMENTKTCSLIWGSQNKPKPHASFSSVGTEKNTFLKSSCRENKNGEVQTETKIPLEREKEKESPKLTGPQGWPKFPASRSQPSHNNPSSWVDSKEPHFLLREGDRKEERGKGEE